MAACGTRGRGGRGGRGGGAAEPAVLTGEVLRGGTIGRRTPPRGLAAGELGDGARLEEREC